MVFSRTSFSMPFSVALLLITTVLSAQTDAGIFREFQFDFSTPGARANAMGRAFVGLADEATAAYSNPAGLSVLATPELSLEGRSNRTLFPALRPTDGFAFPQEGPPDTEVDLSRLGFGSYSFSRNDLNFSLFYVNNLDYQRNEVSDRLIFERDPTVPTTTLIDQHHVRGIQLNTYGLSTSRTFGKLAMGFALGLAQLDLDYQYNFRANNPAFISQIQGEAKHSSLKPAYVVGLRYSLSSRLHFGFSHKRQPRFSYTEQFETPAYAETREATIRFKIPDSTQLGLAFQPNDRWTLLFDIDWTRYSQQVGENMTQLSPIRFLRGSLRGFRVFEQDAYYIKDDPNYRTGGEYLIPIQKNIIALRAGAFLDPDHRTRFAGVAPTGTSPTDSEIIAAVYDTYRFIYNTGSTEDDLGVTGGLGFVWHNKIQVDAAIVRSDRLSRGVFSVLYRF